MKFFKYFVISFFSFIGLIIVVSLFLPSQIDAELTANIKIKKKYLFNYLSDIDNVNQWSMWGVDNDSTLTYKTEADYQTQLPVYKWTAELLGAGFITFTQVKQDTLEFLTSLYEDEFEMYGFISLKQIGNETIIYRRQTMDLGSNPVYKIVGYIMQEYISKDLKSELDKIKELAEAMEPMEHTLKILYDNSAQGEKLKYGWGFSCVINDTLLFDTGEDFEKLQYNIKEMEIDISKITTLIISHDHWDHTGGLKEIVPVLPNLQKIYLPQSSSSELKSIAEDKAIMGNSKYVSLSENIILTKNFKTEYKGNTLYEQSLLLKTEDSFYTILAGCAHPGIDVMVSEIEKDLDINIKAVIGGFHLTNAKDEKIISIALTLKELGITKVGPTHCSGKNAKEIFKNEFPGNYINIFTGKEVEID